jgi:hypothetical protein
MIIKIERYKNQKYWMWDNIRKFSLSKSRYRNITCTEGPVCWDAVIFDMNGCDCRSNGKTPEKNCDDCAIFYVLTCRLDNDSEHTIAFDTIAYIMNDQGKTIEKIVANYNTQMEQ